MLKGYDLLLYLFVVQMIPDPLNSKKIRDWGGAQNKKRTKWTRQEPLAINYDKTFSTRNQKGLKKQLDIRVKTIPLRNRTRPFVADRKTLTAVSFEATLQQKKSWHTKKFHFVKRCPAAAGVSPSFPKSFFHQTQLKSKVSLKCFKVHALASRQARLLQ